MKKVTSLFICVILLYACGDNNQTKLKKMIGVKPKLTSIEVVNVATQLHLMASANSVQLLADSNKTVPLFAYQEMVFKQYKTSNNNYKYAYTYYAQNADTLLWIHNEIITQLSVLQAKESK